MLLPMTPMAHMVALGEMRAIGPRMTQCPGGNAEGEDHGDGGSIPQADPHLTYQPRYPVLDDHIFDVVHRHSEAMKLCKNERSKKKVMMEKFMETNARMYDRMALLRPISVRTASQASKNIAGDHRDAIIAQKQFAKQAAAADAFAGGVAGTPRGRHGDGQPAIPPPRQLLPQELPRSPARIAAELIARSGVWKSKEQYLATLFVLEPLQTMWEKARREGRVMEMGTPDILAHLSQGNGIARRLLAWPWWVR